MSPDAPHRTRPSTPSGRIGMKADLLHALYQAEAHLNDAADIIYTLNNKLVLRKMLEDMADAITMVARDIEGK